MQFSLCLFAMAHSTRFTVLTQNERIPKEIYSYFFKLHTVIYFYCTEEARKLQDKTIGFFSRGVQLGAGGLSTQRRQHKWLRALLLIHGVFLFLANAPSFHTPVWKKALLPARQC